MENLQCSSYMLLFPIMAMVYDLSQLMMLADMTHEIDVPVIESPFP